MIADKGKQILVSYRGDIVDTLIEMKQDMQLSISYAGGKELSVLKAFDYAVI